MSDIKVLPVAQYENSRKIMYLAKEMLLSSEKINISSTTNSAGIGARAAETLVRLGYVTYENIRTDTIIENDRKKTRFIITIKKTPRYEQLYKENEEIRKKREEDKKANENK